ncbi:hypothetical protein [Micromonospora arida]
MLDVPEIPRILAPAATAMAVERMAVERMGAGRGDRPWPLTGIAVRLSEQLNRQRHDQCGHPWPS